jgi:hypothetical protein
MFLLFQNSGTLGLYLGDRKRRVKDDRRAKRLLGRMEDSIE